MGGWLIGVLSVAWLVWELRDARAGPAAAALLARRSCRRPATVIAAAGRADS